MRHEQRLRLNRIYNEPIFLMDAHEPHEDSASFGTPSAYDFSVSGATRTLYDVCLRKDGTCRCSCPDMQKVHPTMRMCKHICFVLFRVLKYTDHALFDRNCTLNSQEVDLLIVKCRGCQFFTDPTFTTQRPIEEDSECPICYCTMGANDKDNPVIGCPECKNNVHAKCMQKWLTKRNTCVYCRSTAWINYKMPSVMPGSA